MNWKGTESFCRIRFFVGHPFLPYGSIPFGVYLFHSYVLWLRCHLQRSKCMAVSGQSANGQCACHRQ